MTNLTIKASICKRALKIVARVYGEVPATHGFYNPEGFVAACKLRGERDRVGRLVLRVLVEVAGHADRDALVERGLQFRGMSHETPP